MRNPMHSQRFVMILLGLGIAVPFLAGLILGYETLRPPISEVALWILAGSIFVSVGLLLGFLVSKDSFLRKTGSGASHPQELAQIHDFVIRHGRQIRQLQSESAHSGNSAEFAHELETLLKDLHFSLRSSDHEGSPQREDLARTRNQ